MPYSVLLKRSAEKELDKLPRGIQDRVIGRLLSLRDTPRPAGARKLVGREGYRLRVGEHRILYEVDDPKQQVEVFSIAHRREVYRR